MEHADAYRKAYIELRIKSVFDEILHTKEQAVDAQAHANDGWDKWRGDNY